MAIRVAARRLLSSPGPLFFGVTLALTACSGGDNDNPAGEGGSSNAQGGATGSGGAATTGGASSGGAPGNGGSVANGGSGFGGASSGGAASGGTVNGGASSGGSANGGGANGGSANAGGTGSSGSASGGAAMGGKSAGGAAAGGKASGGSGMGGAASGGKASGGAATGGKASGGASSGGNASGGSGGGSCPFTGHVSYTLSKAANPTQAEQDAYTRITTAMDKAIGYYNCYTNITKALNVSYVPSVATADGNINGSMRFGSNTTYMDYRTAMHEIGHTVGIGQASNWNSFITNGIFTGSNALAQLQAINATLPTPADTQVHADSQHFWPFGINQQSEVKSEADLISHCKMVMAIRKDLGLQ